MLYSLLVLMTASHKVRQVACHHIAIIIVAQLQRPVRRSYVIMLNCYIRNIARDPQVDIKLKKRKKKRRKKIKKINITFVLSI